MMRLLAPLVVIAATAAVLMLTPAEVRIVGLDHHAFAVAGALLAMLIYLLGGARPSDVARAVSSVAAWAALLVALVGVYAYRFEAADFFDRVAAELLPSEPQAGEGGEAIVNRRLSGEFSVVSRVNGARVTFLFDTGASMVVLTAADARTRLQRPGRDRERVRAGG
jgi:aspartyl protease family protein